MLSAKDEHNIISVKMYALTVKSVVCVRAQTLLRASTLSRHTPQANSLAFLMPCLRIQVEKSRELSSGYTHTEQNLVICILIGQTVTTGLLIVNISEHHQLFLNTFFDLNYVE